MNPAAAVHLSLVIPCYNEARRLPAGLDAILAYLQTQPYAWEVLVVDDGSTDGTPDFVARRAADEPRLKLHRLPHNVGKGGTVKAGLLAAAGEYVFFTDADLSTPVTYLAEGLRRLESGAHLVYADRHMPGATLRGYNPIRLAMSRTFNLCTRSLLLPGVSDTQCGFKGFRREVIPALLERLTEYGFAFDVELLVIARARGWTLAGFPVVWDNVKASKVKPFSDALAMFASLLTIRKRRRRGDYGR